MEALVPSGRRSARSAIRARILLLSDQGEGGHGWEDRRVAEALGCGHRTVEGIRERFVTEGVDAALIAKARSHAPRQCWTGPPRRG